MSGKQHKTLGDHLQGNYHVTFKYFVEGIENTITYESDDYKRNPAYWEKRFADLQECKPVRARALSIVW
jgi:acid phosphatase class B